MAKEKEVIKIVLQSMILELTHIEAINLESQLVQTIGEYESKRKEN